MRTSELREAWRQFECAASDMTRIKFGPDQILVAPPTVDAWNSLAAVLHAYDYKIRTTDTDSYNCRRITGGVGKSLHAFGIALDINWKTNPYIDHEGRRNVRFSGKPTQSEREIDVKHARADTDMSVEMIDDIMAIKTRDGLRVFEWGGHWQSVKDAMHFEIDLSPEQLARGIDSNTVVTRRHDDVTRNDNPQRAAPAARSDNISPGVRHKVIARSGLRLRSGGGVEFDIIDTLAYGSNVFVLSMKDDWALVDIQGDRRVDGYMYKSFLARSYI